MTTKKEATSPPAAAEPAKVQKLNIEEPVDKVRIDLRQAGAEAPPFAKFLLDSSQAAKEREKHIKSINQAKWFIKLKKGVSDTLKSKCLPLNKKTQELIKQTQAAFKKMNGHIEACKKAFESFDKAKQGTKERTTSLEAILKGADHLADWENFAAIQRSKIKSAVEGEKEAIQILDNYIKGKDAAKEMGEEAYKSFKKEHEKLAEDL